MKPLFFSLLFLTTFLAHGQKRYCKQGICVYEDSLFYSNVYYRGQFVRFHYYVENTTNELKGERPAGRKMARVLKNGSLQYAPDQNKKQIRSSNCYFTPSEEKSYFTLNPHKRSGRYFDAHRSGLANDSVLEYFQRYGKKNSLIFLAPGKYVFSYSYHIAPSDQLVALEKKIEVLEVPDSLKQQFFDFLKSVNYLKPIEIVDKNIGKLFDSEQPSIVWYCNKYPSGLYTDELFLYLTYYKSTWSLSLEGKAKFGKQLLDLIPKMRGNGGIILESLDKLVNDLDLMYTYRLIEDEKETIDKLLKQMENMPVALSEACIRHYRFRHQDQTLINYAKLKFDQK